MRNDVAAFGEFDHECVFVEFFVEARPECVEHFHRGTDGVFAEFLVNQFGHGRGKRTF